VPPSYCSSGGRTTEGLDTQCADFDPYRLGFSVADEAFVQRLHKDGMGLLKIGKTLGVGTGLVQGVVHPFEASAAVSTASA
jgi:hypothetical protein